MFILRFELVELKSDDMSGDPRECLLHGFNKLGDVAIRKTPIVFSFASSTFVMTLDSAWAFIALLPLKRFFFFQHSALFFLACRHCRTLIQNNFIIFFSIYGYVDVVQFLRRLYGRELHFLLGASF